MISWFRRNSLRARLVIAAGLVLAAGSVIYARYQRTFSWIAHPRFQSGLGKTVIECQAEYGRPNLITSNPNMVCPQTRGYIKWGWSLMIGFDEAGKAEQFVLSTAGLGRRRDLTPSELSALLDGFKEGHSWLAIGDKGNGPCWRRSDGQAYSGYVAEQRWLVIMNVRCMDRHIERNSAAHANDNAE